MPASAPRRRLGADDRRRQLIDLGLELLSRRPAEQVQVDDIARAAGISRGLLFHYFPSKRHFQLAVVSAAAEQLAAVTEPRPEWGGPGPEVLRRGLEAFADYVDGHRRLYVGLVRGAAGADPALQAIFDRTRGLVVRRVLEGLGLDPATVAPTLRTAVRGWVGFVEESTLDRLTHGDPGRDELVGLQVAALVGLLPSVAPGLELDGAVRPGTVPPG